MDFVNNFCTRERIRSPGYQFKVSGIPPTSWQMRMTWISYLVSVKSWRVRWALDQTANQRAEAGHDRLLHDASIDAEPIPELEFYQTLGW